MVFAAVINNIIVFWI